MKKNHHVKRWPGGEVADVLAIEEPLEIRVEGKVLAITMRTPGHDRELMAGVLWSSGVIEGADDIRAMAEVGKNTMDVRLSEGVCPKPIADRSLFASSACGLCGEASWDRLQRAGGVVERWEPTVELAFLAMQQLRAGQALFQATGGVHGAGLLGETGVTRIFEDVGRHNALDKVLGSALLSEQPVRGLVVSSRVGFELVQKAWVAGAGVLVAAGAPSSLAVETAMRANICLLGWVTPAGTTSVGRLVQFC